MLQRTQPDQGANTASGAETEQRTKKQLEEKDAFHQDLLGKQMAQSQGITEALKAQNQLAWVGAMNNIRNAAEEIVLFELIYN